MCCLRVGNQSVAWWRQDHLSDGHLRQIPRRGGCHLSWLTGSILDTVLIGNTYHYWTSKVWKHWKEELPGCFPTDISQYCLGEQMYFMQERSNDRMINVYVFYSFNGQVL